MRADGTSSADLAALIEQLEDANRKNRQMGEKLRRLETSTVQKAQAQGKTVDYGRAPRPGKKPISVGVMSPEDIASGRYSHASGGRSGSNSRAGSAERKSSSPDPYAAAAATPRSGSSRPSTAPASAAATGAPAADDRLVSTLRDENDTLRRQLTEALVASRAAQTAAASLARSDVGGGGLGGLGGGGGGSFSLGLSGASRAEAMEIERQLKDRTAQLTLLRSRYEHLETKASAERQLYDRAVSALEEQNAQIRDARTALQAAEADVSLLRARLRAQEDAETELRSAREEIRRLERSLTDLCESPFMAEGKDRVAKGEQLEQAQRDAATAKEQVAHLQHTVRSQHLELTALRKEKKDMQEAQDGLRGELSGLKTACDAAARANATLRERLALYSGVVGMEGTASAASAPGSSDTGAAHHGGGGGLGVGAAVPPEELERALTLVRKRLDQPGTVDGMSGSGGSGSGGGADATADTPALRRKVQQLQLALLSTQRELERSEAMLRAQTAIAQDLSAEVAELNERLSGETGAVKRRLADTETLAEKRLQRVHMLEAQVKELMQKLKDVAAAAAERKKTAKDRAAASAASETGASASGPFRRASSGIGLPGAGAGGRRRGVDDNNDDDDASTVISALSGDEEEDEAAAARQRREAGGSGAVMSSGTRADDSAEDSLGGSMLDFGPGEDALELYVVEATLDPAALGRHDATFALLDFFDFDSQTSPLAMGPAPAYNFSAAYRVVTDSFFLRHIAAHGATVDINQARGAEFELVARAVLPLHRLLAPGTTKLRFPALPLVSKSGKVVGSVKVEVRAAVPLGEQWAQFQRDHPAEGARLAAAMRERDDRDAVDGGGGGSGFAPASSAPASASSAPTAGDGGIHTANELLVTVVGASDLKAGAGALSLAGTSASLPSTYVQYTLPGSAVSAVTPVVRNSASPVFADARTFPLVPTPRLLSALATTPVAFVIVDDGAAASRGGNGSSSGSGSVLGTATVSLASVADGGSLDATFDVVDARGVSVGKLHVRAKWSRPLAAVDGAPPDTLTRAQLQALAAVFDRDGAGVKHELLYLTATMQEEDARALDRLREAVAAHERALTSDATGVGAGSRKALTKWTQALSEAAEAAGRSDRSLTPREAFAALGAAHVAVPVDLATVEDAVLGLLPSGASSVPVADLVDVATPLTPTAASAIGKVRRFVAGMSKAKGAARLDYALEDEAEAAAKKAYGDRPTREQCARLARSGLANALKACGMVLAEDASASRATGARDPRAAPDFASDPSAGADRVAAAIAAAAPALERTVVGEQAVGAAGATVHPTLVTESAAAAMAAVQQQQQQQPVAAVDAAATAATAAARRSSSTRELVFDGNAPAAVAPAAAMAAATAETAVSAITPALRPVESYAGPASDPSQPALVVDVHGLAQLHPALLAARGTAGALYVSFTVPPAAAAAAGGVQVVVPVLVGTLAGDGKSASLAPYPRAFGSGSAFGATTSEFGRGGAKVGRASRAPCLSPHLSHTFFPVTPFSLPSSSLPLAAFPLKAGSSLAAALAPAFASGAVPEHSDVLFTLSTAPPATGSGGGSGSASDPSSSSSSGGFSSPSDVVATGCLSLLDLVLDGKDSEAAEVVLRATATAGAALGGAAGVAANASLGSLTVSVLGWKALKGLRG